MKRCLAAFLLLLLLCAAGAAVGEGTQYPDGVYRGFYYEDGLEQVAVQFELKDGVFQSVVLRSLNRKQTSLMTGDVEERYKEGLRHFGILADYLVGKGVDAIDELYHPEEILAQVGMRALKKAPYSMLVSALWDGLNRRPFKLVDTSKLPEADPYADGLYRGTYEDDDGEQIVLEFTVHDNCITQIRYLKLEYKDVDYLSDAAPDAAQKMAGQFQELIDYLVGKSIKRVNDLYQPAEIATDTDVSSAATLRTPKIISAIWDGLNKNAYIVH